jgi:hypothetical protein
VVVGGAAHFIAAGEPPGPVRLALRVLQGGEEGLVVALRQHADAQRPVPRHPRPGREGQFANERSEADVRVPQAVVEGLVGEEVAAPVADDGQAGLPPGFSAQRAACSRQPSARAPADVWRVVCQWAAVV